MTTCAAPARSSPAPAFAATLGKRIPYEISDTLDVAVRQTGAPSEGLLRDWPEVASGAEKNYGYAFQWWALSVLIAILYAWFQFIAPRRKASRA